MKRVVSSILVILMLAACLIGCSKDEDKTESGTAGDDLISTDTSDGDVPTVPKQDNGGREFNILYPNTHLFEKYYFAEKVNGQLVNDVNYRRMTEINEHLGIKIVPIHVATIEEVPTRITTATQSGDDSYQLALTHCYAGVLGLATGGHLYDYNEIPHVNLDADYWRGESMKSLAVSGKLFLGSGSFILYEPTTILFNKDMVNSFPNLKVEDLYKSVKEKTWTIEKLKTYAKNVDIDGNENLVNPEDGKYGFASQINYELNAFMAVNGYFVASKGQDDTYTLTGYNQRIDDIVVAIRGLMGEEYSYGWQWSANAEGAVDIGKGNTMFVTSGLPEMITTIANSQVKIGILPYPTIEEGMDTQCFDWAGFLVIPSSVQNTELSGAVAELMCYYGKKELYPAFYEELLGARTAQNMDDVEMLDLIFSSLVHDPALAYCQSSTSDLGALFYTVPNLVNQSGTGVSSYFAGKAPSAKIDLEDIYV